MQRDARGWEGTGSVGYAEALRYTLKHSLYIPLALLPTEDFTDEPGHYDHSLIK